MKHVKSKTKSRLTNEHLQFSLKVATSEILHWKLGEKCWCTKISLIQIFNNVHIFQTTVSLFILASFLSIGNDNEARKNKKEIGAATVKKIKKIKQEYIFGK